MNDKKLISESVDMLRKWGVLSEDKVKKEPLKDVIKRLMSENGLEGWILKGSDLFHKKFGYAVEIKSKDEAGVLDAIERAKDAVKITPQMVKDAIDKEEEYLKKAEQRLEVAREKDLEWNGKARQGIIGGIGRDIQRNAKEAEKERRDAYEMVGVAERIIKNLKTDPEPQINRFREVEFMSSKKVTRF